MSKAKEQPKKREEEKQNRPLDPLLTHGLRRGMRGQMLKLFSGKDPKRGSRGSRRYLGILRGGGGHVVLPALTLSDRTESVQSPEKWVREKTPE